MRDVSTMAHEFGHAIHSMYASDKPILVSHAPLPLAETASVFGEMLLNEEIYKKLNRERKRFSWQNKLMISMQPLCDRHFLQFLK